MIVTFDDAWHEDMPTAINNGSAFTSLETFTNLRNQVAFNQNILSDQLVINTIENFYIFEQSLLHHLLFP